MLAHVHLEIGSTIGRGRYKERDNFLIYFSLMNREQEEEKKAFCRIARCASVSSLGWRAQVSVACTEREREREKKRERKKERDINVRMQGRHFQNHTTRNTTIGQFKGVGKGGGSALFRRKVHPFVQAGRKQISTFRLFLGTLELRRRQYAQNLLES
jgi:hypothetical protein